ncbi:MAG: hypothetical protein N4A35_17065 [Flavobacteriales bacterium]|jgi:hypothetical protein|nr:hypothetical protein [Flavobacteriales bacterium]
MFFKKSSKQKSLIIDIETSNIIETRKQIIRTVNHIAKLNQEKPSYESYNTLSCCYHILIGLGIEAQGKELSNAYEELHKASSCLKFITK